MSANPCQEGLGVCRIRRGGNNGLGFFFGNTTYFAANDCPFDNAGEVSQLLGSKDEGEPQVDDCPHKNNKRRQY